jgi:polyhydroxybutyrate depolymerase
VTVHRIACAALALGAWLCAAPVVAGCNGAAEPCHIPQGTYHIVLPPGAKGPVPAILMLHGHGGDGAGMIRNRDMVDRMLGRGHAVIAPDGQPRANGRGRSWDFHPDRPATRDEGAFLSAVADDAAARFGLDRGRMLLAGFSVGGSMASYVACSDPAAFAAYAPVAGSFWRPHPAGCAGPVRLLHTHGIADETVPLTGREVAPGFRQGDVPEAMEIWRRTNGCSGAGDPAARGIYRISRAQGCLPGSDLWFVLHEGGHVIPPGWAAMALDWFGAP